MEKSLSNPTVGGRGIWTLALLVACLALFGCGGGGGSSGGGSGSGSGSSGSSGGGITYVTFTNSANGPIILDGANHSFEVDSSSRDVLDVLANVWLTGLSVDTANNVWSNSVEIGTVGAGTSNGGSTIAVFLCSGGSSMTINVLSSGWSYSCASGSSSGGTGSSSSSSGGTSSGGTSSSGSSSGGSSSGSGSVCGSFYTDFTNEGNANGCVVLDGSGTQYGIGLNTGEIYLYSSETGMAGTSIVNGYNNGLGFVTAQGAVLGYVQINGTIYGNILLEPDSSGGNVAVFQCLTGVPMVFPWSGSSWSLPSC